MKDYKELDVWKKAIDFVKVIYEKVKLFPIEEKYGLTDQLKRAVVSIPANIAEGSGRNTTKEFIQFLYIALGSACEVETLLIISYKLNYLSNISELLKEIESIKKMLNALIISLKKKIKNTNHEPLITNN